MVRDGRVVFCSKSAGAAMAGLYPLGALKGEIIDKTSARTGLEYEQNGGRTAVEYSTPGVGELARHAQRDTAVAMEGTPRRGKLSGVDCRPRWSALKQGR